jgi:hypothetical protein
MAQITFKANTTKLSRGYLICKETDTVATFENNILSVALQVKDTVNNQGLIVVATKEKTGLIVISAIKDTTLDFPQTWAISYKWDMDSKVPTLEINNLPEGVGVVKVTEV